MRILLTCFIATVLITSCQQATKQYAEEGPEIDLGKKVISSYETKNWASFISVYSDTAKIFHNSVESMTVDEVVARHKEILTPISQYKFQEDMEWDFVTTNKGRQWVDFWGVWEGTLAATGQVFKTPVHLSLEVKNGKIVREYGYWDNAPMTLALMELASKEMEPGEE